MSDLKTVKLESDQSRTLKKAIRELKPIQIWDWLFRSCELNGRVLLSEGVITAEDLEECIDKGKCKKLSIRLPAWCILQCLLRSAKLHVNGLLISDGVELTDFTWPKDKVLEWLFGPLVIMKEQMKGLHLDENEESCLRTLIMANSNERPEDWEGSGFSSGDMVRRAQLQAILRRLQGMVASLSILPTFRRRFNSLVKSLYVDAVEVGGLSMEDVHPRIKGKLAALLEERRNHDKNNEKENCNVELV
ncbi:hypothetical protein HPP92_007271 [Vanilla planifolia]|uniref:Uncharacterized protein n=1 Tax=Vanilla planifolia TaxID=51239 RepID=A0A835RH77_VANPL|nr:hypothetical protein HPP92_007271 [Vanilla planifolia]